MPAERAYFPAVPTELMTADELLRANLPDRRVELIRGVLVVREPAGGRHGRVAAELARLIGTHVHDHHLGVVYGAETGFTLTRGPDTVRAPDVAFLQRDRVPTPEPGGFLPLAPDLAVEILSPDDRPGETLAKVGYWLEAGTRLIWVVDPDPSSDASLPRERLRIDHRSNRVSERRRSAPRLQLLTRPDSLTALRVTTPRSQRAQ